MLHIQVSGQVGFGVAKADAACVFVRRLPRYRFPLAPLSHVSDLQRRRRRRRSFPLLRSALRFPFKATLVTPEFRFAPPGKLSSYFQTSVASKQATAPSGKEEGRGAWVFLRCYSHSGPFSPILETGKEHRTDEGGLPNAETALTSPPPSVKPSWPPPRQR